MSLIEQNQFVNVKFINIENFEKIEQSMFQFVVSFDFYVFDIQSNYVVSIVRLNNISFVFKLNLIFLNFNKFIFQNDNKLTQFF